MGFQGLLGNDGMMGMDDMLADAETEEVLSEFDFLGPDSAEGMNSDTLQLL